MTFLEGLKSFLFPSTDPLPWTKCDRNEFKRKINTFCKSIDSPYLSPLLYKNYDSLTDVPLYLLSGEFCPLLDDSITMAKIWKGPVESKHLLIFDLRNDFRTKSILISFSFYVVNITNLFFHFYYS